MLKKKKNNKSYPATNLEQLLDELKLRFIREHYYETALQCAKQKTCFIEFLDQLIQGEHSLRHDRFIERRIKAAKFPVIKTLDQFNWDWPKQSPEQTIKALAHFEFIKQHKNIILVGSVGLGKSHLAIALGYMACLAGFSVMFTTAVEMVHNLVAATHAGSLKRELKRYKKPDLLILDELGYLPLDKHGGDLLFQVISQRYETGSIIVTTNRVYKQWPEIFNNDATLTSALLDRLLHHSETITLMGKSYRTVHQ